MGRLLSVSFSLYIKKILDSIDGGVIFFIVITGCAHIYVSLEQLFLS